MKQSLGIKKNKPEVIQLDGLEGECFRLHTKLKKDNPNANYILFSGRRDLLDKASNRGMKTFNKGHGSEYLEKYATELFKQ